MVSGEPCPGEDQIGQLLVLTHHPEANRQSPRPRPLNGESEAEIPLPLLRFHADVRLGDFGLARYFDRTLQSHPMTVHTGE